MSIKTVFSIKDLENLSGVKAHTIRIWEKRYQLFTPIRSETNIRSYSNDDLKKILNIALLNKNGIKVSKIAKLSSQEIHDKVIELSECNNEFEAYSNQLKLAMYEFDMSLFEATFQKLMSKHDFDTIYVEVFIQLLNQIGMLWHSNSIKPAHEHFISSLIMQKILVQIERLPKQNLDKSKSYIIFLPHNEIHQIGVLYIYYAILRKSYHAIFLGPNVPINDLVEIKKIYKNADFLSYFTVAPSTDSIDFYLKSLQHNVLNNKLKMHLFGNKLMPKEVINAHHNIIYYDSPKNFIDTL